VAESPVLAYLDSTLEQPITPSVLHEIEAEMLKPNATAPAAGS
jgi:hypothetical protein